MIITKNASDIEKMAVAGAIVRDVLALLQENAKEGVSTEKLDALAESYIRKCGAIPSFLGYGGYPKSVCISIDDEVVHGIPKRDVILTEGMIVSFDVGAKINGFHGDAARTVAIGKVTPEKIKLMEVTKECFFKGVEKFAIGNRIGDIANAVQKHAEANGFSVVRDLVGHGIGKDMHEDPQVPNFGDAGRGVRLLDGMALAIEPMINLGGAKVDFLSDGWTVRTRDRKPSAHYENTVVLIGGETKILTL